MRYCKGTIVDLRQCGGCVEVIVAGESPGAFPIDNSCFRMIAGGEGTDWIGRPVEYEDAHMRFLDLPETSEETVGQSSLPHFPRPAPFAPHV